MQQMQEMLMIQYWSSKRVRVLTMMDVADDDYFVTTMAKKRKLGSRSPPIQARKITKSLIPSSWCFIRSSSLYVLGPKKVDMVA